MAHTTQDKDRLLKRVRRLRGQVEAIERALTEERECGELLQLIAAVRGATGGLMTEVVEGHVRHHIVDPSRRPASAQAEATRELLEALRTYLR
ncbi:metal/formaldehyde-sensitive transcriptional repressor [Aggregicoccus sp. 17bor-14]|uniref:metal/formaldehyde-sensitive transcriptional repressor n=1 Tax=Myxococcaceae TaxID=31 RepID=UPI00129CFF1A|nr:MULTISPECIES: metal/formaldehyde-sensitive transcriptional repressor [Myxococcaceae]MBF5046469.1 metal/formaldehyde-sensitive transcriptional repressor [Simulacricoccus sp. 17bor-14]MRI92186.1 metal/formaldehyde-sensitive transcriptional repressor [Aggregicoccus sp. 17bor-14]